MVCLKKFSLQKGLHSIYLQLVGKYKGWIHKVMTTVRYFWHGFIYRNTFMYLPSSRLLIYHLLPNIWKTSYTISASIFVDIPYWPHGLMSDENLPFSARKRYVMAAAVWFLALSWRMMGFCNTKCRHMLHAVPKNILVNYDLVPLQFWSRNIALGFKRCLSALALSLWKSTFYTLQ